jgi:preprotein translocase subunit YajC
VPYYPSNPLSPDATYSLLQLILYVMSFLTVILIFFYIASERPAEKRKKQEEEED